MFTSLMKHALSGLSLVAAAGAASFAAAEPLKVDAPIVHENLGVYLIRGASAPGPVPLTLAEAMAKGAIAVHETGRVEQLLVENTGSEEVFIQAGDIVKGGQQDRVLVVSMLIPTNSGKVPIGAFCVEQGRWSARGKEDVKRFASAEKTLPSREAKLAMLAPRPAKAAAPGPVPQATAGIAQHRITDPGQSASRQGDVWKGVQTVQDKLARNLAGSVAATASASSLQLSLEHERLAKARGAYVTALRDKPGEAGDIVGVAFAINGRISNAEVYASNALFRKMWGKLLDAAATEAIGEKSEVTKAAPEPAVVHAFLAASESGPAAERVLDSRIVNETRDRDTQFISATKMKSGALVHRSHLAK